MRISLFTTIVALGLATFADAANWNGGYEKRLANLAGKAGSSDCYFMTGGVMKCAANVGMVTGRGYGLVMVKGGEFLPDYSVRLGVGGGHGEIYIANAKFANKYGVYCGEGATGKLEDNKSVITVAEGGSASMNSIRHVAGDVDYSTIINLNAGGRLCQPWIGRKYLNRSHMYLNSNGGIFAYGGRPHDLWEWHTAGKIDPHYPADRLTVYEGGVTFDISSSTIKSYCSWTKQYAWQTPIVKPTGKGIKSITLKGDLNKLHSAPAKLLITSRVGEGATAVCDFEPVVADKGRTARVIVTNPGWGYEKPSDITCQAIFADDTKVKLACEIELEENSQLGGVTKTGVGTMLICCTNTYGGATIVNEGTYVALCPKAFPETTDIFVSTQAIVELGGFATTVRGIGGAGQIKNGSVDFTVHEIHVKLAEARNGYRFCLNGTGKLVLAADAKVIVDDYSSALANVPAVECAVSCAGFGTLSGLKIGNIPVVDAKGVKIAGWSVRQVGNYVLKVGKNK